MDWNRVAEPSVASNNFIAELAKKRWAMYKSGLMLSREGRELCDWLWDAKDEPRIEATLKALYAWPEGAEAATLMAETYRPLTAKPPDYDGVGCSCGHDIPSATKGAEIYSTVDDPIGGAEGIVHETGHLRLKALGINLEDHDGRLLDEDEKPVHNVVSPIRKDVLRPITAVLHAQYSYVMVTYLDVILEDHRHVLFNLPRILEGSETLKEHAKWTDVGKQFAKGLREWTERVILEAQMLS